MPIYYDELAGWAHPGDVFVLLHKDDENSFWLDREHHATSRFSVIGASPKLHTGPGVDLLATQLHSQEALALPFDFRPGMVGVLDYEGVGHFMHIDRAIVFDHDAKRFFLIVEFQDKVAYNRWKQAALLRIGLCGGELSGYRLRNHALTASEVSVRHSDDEYLKLIARAKEHISAGDVYQLCLTNSIRMRVEGDALSSFIGLRETNPAPYASYFKFGDVKLICCSPEQFIQVDGTGKVSSKPIKGTRPRHADAERDAQAASELAANEKERAENLMIVDLMRNDIGSVAQSGSVEVPKLFDVESFATVHQLVSTVEARLATGKTVVDLLRVAFPGGSMTGAPKLKAIELLRVLESKNGQDSRGMYSGAAGFMTHSGMADFGMVIRSVVVHGNHAYIGVGGGITIDSEPVAELAEIKIKAAALLGALGADYPAT